MSPAIRKHPPANCAKQTEELAAKGSSIVGIARSFGVSTPTFKRWCEEHESIAQALEVGREVERQALHAMIYQSALANKPANANAMFLLKCRHGYREFDAPIKKDEKGDEPRPVMVVRDFGTDEEWAARAAEQQRKLTADNAPIIPASRLIEAPVSSMASSLNKG